MFFYTRRFISYTSFAFSNINQPKLKNENVENIVIQLPRGLVLYIFPFGLVRLRTIRLAQELVRCNINAGVHAHAERMCHSEMSK